MPSSDAAATNAPRVLPYGDQAFLVELATSHDVVMFADALRDDAPAGVTELVPAARTVLVRHDLRGTAADALAGALAAIDFTSARSVAVDAHSALVTVDVRYDGEDLAVIARTCAITVDEVIRRHVSPLYRSAFCGFAPGFAYLTGLDPRLFVPRLDAPRGRVAAASVAIASEYTGVYPNDMPGGWRILGHTNVVLWDLARPQPALLAPGTMVRFRAVDR